MGEVLEEGRGQEWRGPESSYASVKTTGPHRRDARAEWRVLSPAACHVGPREWPRGACPHRTFWATCGRSVCAVNIRLTAADLWLNSISPRGALAPVDHALGLTWFLLFSPELLVSAGRSVQMGCVLPSTEEKRVTKVDWTFSPGERAQVTRASGYRPRWEGSDGGDREGRDARSPVVALRGLGLRTCRSFSAVEGELV